MYVLLRVLRRMELTRVLCCIGPGLPGAIWATWALESGQRSDMAEALANGFIRDVAAAILLETSCNMCLCLNCWCLLLEVGFRKTCASRESPWIEIHTSSDIKWYQVMCSLIQMWHKWYLSGRIMNSCDSCADFSCEIFGQEPRTCRICDFNHGRNKVGFLPVLSSGHAMTPAMPKSLRALLPKSPWLFQY